MSSNTRNQLERWLKTIDVNGSVLDIGGSQNPICNGRTKSWLVNNYKILDLEQPHECKRKPDIIGDVQCGKINSIYIEETFDIAFCLEVSEYWWNPVQALLNINSLLKKDGLLFISFHLLYPRHKPLGLDYLRYTPEGAERLLREAGFEIVENISRVLKDDFSGSTLVSMIVNEGMRGWKDFDISEIGSLITARKK